MTIGDPQSVLTTFRNLKNDDFEMRAAALESQPLSNQRTMTPGMKSRDEKLYNVCIEFESIFIKQMLNSMRKNVEKGDLLHGGMAEEIFEDMLYDEYSLQTAKSSHFGLADLVYRQLSPEQAGIIQPEKKS